jgi:uncharacterized protein (TIGR00251 family)
VIELTAHADGCIIAVRAQPGARRNGVVGEQNGALKVAVTAPADRGRANKALADVLAEALGIKKSQVELLSGATARDKRILVRGVTVEEVRRRLPVLAAAPQGRRGRSAPSGRPLDGQPPANPTI